MTKKSHPAEAANNALIAKAIRFDVALFLGRGQYEHGSGRTLDEAVAEAAAMKAAHPGNGRAALIYAVTPEGRSALVTAPEKAAVAAQARELDRKPPSKAAKVAQILFAGPPA